MWTKANRSREIPSSPRIIKSGSASKAATWATSVRDGFASTRYRARYLIAAPLELRIALLRVQLNERTCIR
jgi:hypothetical protein